MTVMAESNGRSGQAVYQGPDWLTANVAFARAYDALGELARQIDHGSGGRGAGGSKADRIGLEAAAVLVLDTREAIEAAIDTATLALMPVAGAGDRVVALNRSLETLAAEIVPDPAEDQEALAARAERVRRLIAEIKAALASLDQG